MTPEQFQMLRARTNLALHGALRPLARLLRPRPTPAEWSSWVGAAYPAVYRARVEHHAHAERFYLEERARFKPADQVVVPLRSYAPEALDAGLTERVRGRLDALDEGAPVPQGIVTDALDTSERHGAAAGRDAIVDAARHDRRALGYARVTVGAENCAFCLMLVSRGPVYKSESAALYRDGTAEPYHDRCDCIPVPVYDRDDWRGRDEYLEMEAAWREHGGDLLHWRRYVEGLESTATSSPRQSEPDPAPPAGTPPPRDASGGQPPDDPPPTAPDRADDDDPDPRVGDLVPTSDGDAEERSGEIEDAMADRIEGEYVARDGTVFQVTITSVSVRTGEVSVQAAIYVDGLDVGEVIREFLRDGQGLLWVHHDLLSIDSTHQGRGFASVFNGQMEEWYRRSDVDRIELLAGLDVGPYAWAAQGYNFLNEEEAEQVFQGLESEVARIQQWLESAEEDESITDTEYNRQADLLAAAEDILSRTGYPFGSDTYPSAYELSRLGHQPGQGRADSWLGKAVLLASSWKGVKYL